jgi:hypothetical protein
MISWRFTREKAKKVVWDKVDPRDFTEVAIDYKVSPAVTAWLSDEPSMTGEPSPSSSASCDMRFFRANAIFIRAATHCKKNYMDSPAGYYALAMTRQCADLGEEKTLSLAREAMEELDRVAKRRGKAAACQWVDGVEREVTRAATGR